MEIKNSTEYGTDYLVEWEYGNRRWYKSCENNLELYKT